MSTFAQIPVSFLSLSTMRFGLISLPQMRFWLISLFKVRFRPVNLPKASLVPDCVKARFGSVSFSSMRLNSQFVPHFGYKVDKLMRLAFD